MCGPVGPRTFRERQESQLPPREPDARGKYLSSAYTAHEADSDDDYAEQDDYTVGKILVQRRDASGGLEFKMRWRGYQTSHDTLGPLSLFVLWIDTPVLEHVRRHKTKLQVCDLEALTRAIEAISD